MVTVAMRDDSAKAQRWEDGTSGLLPEPYCSAFANLPWLLSVLPCLFRDRRRCAAVIGASVIANPTPVALRSAIALAILIQLLAAVVIITTRTGSPDVADRWPRSPRAIKKDRSHGWVAIVSLTSSPGQTGTCLPPRSNAAAPAETIRFSCADALAAPPYPPRRSARPIGSPSAVEIVARGEAKEDQAVAA